MKQLDRPDRRAIGRLRRRDQVDTDGRFERNAFNSLEEKGLVEQVSGCASGERTYRLTAAGQRYLEKN